MKRTAPRIQTKRKADRRQQGSQAARGARDIVRSALEDYAKRGVFSGFEEIEGPGNTTVFRFIWLHDRPMSLTLDSAKRSLRFDRLLPGAKAGDPFTVDLRRFVQSLKSDDV